jgi:hypothetical protein
MQQPEPTPPREPPPRRREQRRWIVIAVFAIVVAITAARGFNPYTGIAPHIDSGVYVGAAEHILHGRVLYKEIWDHKPPVVHAIDTLALRFGDHTVNSVRSMERWWAALAALAVLAIGFLAFENVALAGVASLLFVMHFYHPNVVRGNQPEEYGSILTLVAILLCVASTACRRWALPSAAASGLFFALACLTKETFALGVIPWPVFLAWGAHQRRTPWLRTVSWYVAGFAVPFAVFLGYLLWNGALDNWLDVLRFNLSYVRFDARNEPNPALLGSLLQGSARAYELVFAVSRVTAVAAMLGAVSVAVRDFRRKSRGLPIVFLAFFLFNLFGVSLARRYGYYYLQLVSGYVLLAACGLAFLLCLARRRRTLQAGIVAVFVGALLTVDGHEAGRFGRALAQRRTTFHGDDEVVSFIRANTASSDPIWNLVREGSAVYAHADRLSPTRFFYISANLFRDLPDPEGARREIGEALAVRPPKIIVFDGDNAWLAKADLVEWFRTNYEPTSVARVFLRRASTASGGPSAMRSRFPEAGSVEPFSGICFLPATAGPPGFGQPLGARAARAGV